MAKNTYPAGPIPQHKQLATEGTTQAPPTGKSGSTGFEKGTTGSGKSGFKK